MFSVIFEVCPKPDRWNDYLGNAKALLPELQKIDGFVDNIRYRSLTREEWILSLSGWRDEKALVRWRIQAQHHEVQAKGRFEIFADYHLRVGQLTQDTQLPPGQSLIEQRLDETQTGNATTVTLIDSRRPGELQANASATDIGRWLGLEPDAAGLQGWDVFDAVLAPGDLILLLSWRDRTAAEAYEKRAKLPPNARLRRVRVIRDYGMFDRREAPQYYPDVQPH